MSKALKIAVIGGGSSYTPELVEGILKRKDELPVSELWLVDIEEGKQKLDIIEALTKRMVKKSGLDIRVFTTLNRREAIHNADFVITQFRVGGLKAREKDELIPLKYDVIGQETTGPGGFAKAMRTIPVILDICSEIEELAPEAWLVNFTNPAGIITEAVKTHSNVKVFGLCNVPLGTKMDIAKLLKVDSKRIRVDFVGLNHMNFITNVYLDGYSILDEIIEKYSAPEYHEQVEAISDIVWDIDFIKSLGMLTSPYHRYYYITKTMLEEEKESVRTNGSRAMQVQRLEKSLFELYKDEDLNVKPKELEGRGGAYYSDAAISLISAIHNDKNEIHTINVLNNGTITNVPSDAIIEANCIVGRNGAEPIHIGAADTKIAGLINYVKSYEKLTIKAAVSGSYYDALMAINANPLVNEYSDAKAILDELLIAHKPYLDYVKK
ncbi:6-phospho-beta-glucosidase [Ruminiclostridium papyrosolvens]|uniref:Diacetylchitobiose-6-phosphate hydrolase n=1 Tax=Ruminiclostridium papyrosolvens C7 TaxID=1330534 RepID=U4R5Q8_9FIRM|nr:6-phospho-beta-glucosidase [Ruminiclostridium papyrosolvens]EPR14036.1 diacetylchitobiose-6-phosphate hydrolase [Ruminiclostridium papyrosolvens C7]